MAQLFQLPVRRPGDGTSNAASTTSTASKLNGWITSVVTAPFKPFLPSSEVDDWGRDEHMIHSLAPVAHMRWKVTVGGEQLLPRSGPALLVANARRMSLSSMYSSWALGDAIGRTVRFVGRPDVAPIGPLMRRLGALLADPDEIASALRNGELVMISAASTSSPRRAGAIDHALLAAAVLTETPVFPVATLSSLTGREARVEVGRPEKLRRKRRGPLAEVELADQVQLRIQELLEEMGGMRTGLGPIDFWGEG